jgi:general secretion pathway protein G
VWSAPASLEIAPIREISGADEARPDARQARADDRPGAEAYLGRTSRPTAGHPRPAWRDVWSAPADAGGRAVPAERGVRPTAGFTLLELLVVMTIIGILAAIAVPALKNSPQKGREAALREDLFTIRETLDEYHGDKGHYPADLATLVTDGYLRKIPVDPITKSADTWQIVLESTDDASSSDSSSSGSSGSSSGASSGSSSDSSSTDSSSSPGSSEEPAAPGIIDVHSGSKAKALDGTTYDTW